MTMSETDVPGLDLAGFATYFGTARPGTIGGPLRASVLPGGRSNLTYAVTDGEHRWVLRRPPLGHVLPTAHDMAREHRVLDALAGAGFPAPEPILLCTDPEVIGAPFYLMEHVDGTIYRDVADAGGDRAPAMRALACRWWTRWPTCTRWTRPRSGWRLRPPGRLQRPPGPPLEEAARRVPQPRRARHRGAARAGWRWTSRPAPARRSCTATTGWTTC